MHLIEIQKEEVRVGDYLSVWTDKNTLYTGQIVKLIDGWNTFSIDLYSDEDIDNGYSCNPSDNESKTVFRYISEWEYVWYGQVNYFRDLDPKLFIKEAKGIINSKNDIYKELNKKIGTIIDINYEKDYPLLVKVDNDLILALNFDEFILI